MDHRLYAMDPFVFSKREKQAVCSAAVINGRARERERGRRLCGRETGGGVTGEGLLVRGDGLREKEGESEEAGERARQPGPLKLTFCTIPSTSCPLGV
ncbi:hypothetical protein SKAU_G00319270 [Synaphobranchus kaupii]|uniref:Uncharacterized protein n=1 Tax=Synaphobranchus kaupii TaxID=118154 RepID=A0A9Q1IJQ1_SYNKA|nr:hypothetical protein SKAU_G00319270 [Synaphobranchus kaupii]